MALEIQYRSRICASEAVYRLVVVADSEYMRFRAAQSMQQLDLKGIGILELIDQDNIEPSGITVSEVGTRAHDRQTALYKIGEFTQPVANARAPQAEGQDVEQVTLLGVER